MPDDSPQVTANPVSRALQSDKPASVRIVSELPTIRKQTNSFDSAKHVGEKIADGCRTIKFNFLFSEYEVSDASRLP